MANTLRFKRGLASGIPTAAAGEPLFTTDTFDLYIGNGTTNTRFQKYIASGATTQILRGDGSLYTFPLAISSPSAGQVLKYNGTSWVNDSDAGITGSGTTNYLPKFTGASTLGNSIIFDNGTSVGISSASPSAGIKLQVDGSVFVNRSGNVNYVLNSASSHYGFIQNDAGNKWSLSSGTSLTTGLGTAALTWFSTGNVSIGNLSDNGLRFQVTGDGYFSGAVAIGDISLRTRTNLTVWKNITGDPTSFGIYNRASIQSGVTSEANMFVSVTETQAASFTLTALKHYRALNAGFGAGSTVTNQFGFIAEAELIGATNNYGFYGNIASGTGRWNLFMNGTAANYLNGSLGIGTTSPSYKLDVQGTSGTVAIRALSNTAGDILFYATGTVTGTLNAFTTSINATGSVAASLQNNNTATGSATLDINVPSASTGDPYITFTTSGATNWSIGTDNSDSDKLKIGNVSNPSNGATTLVLHTTGNTSLGAVSDSGEKLQVTGTMKVTGATTLGATTISTSSSTALAINSSAAACFLGMSDSSGSFTYLGSDNGAMLFQTPASSYSTKMTLDNAGNLGLAVTPSAWGGTVRAMQIGLLGAFSSRTGGNGTYISSNVYFTADPSDSASNAAYIANTSASAYMTGSGSHKWFIAPFGTAGNAITFTQAMTLDASGNLGLGTASPTGIGANWGTIDIRGASGGGLRFGVTSSTNFTVYANASAAVLTTTATIPIIFGNNNTERARFTETNGNLHLGTYTSDSGEKLQVNGTMRVSGQTNIASHFLQNGAGLFRIENTGASAPSGSAGLGIEIFRSGTIAYIEAYNRTSSAYEQLNLRGSTLNFTGAATFSSSVTAGGTITIARGQDANVTNVNINSGVTPVSAFQINTDQPNLRSILMARNGYSLVLGTQDANRVTIDSTGAATFSNALTVTGNLTVDTNTLFVDATNNRVGILTTTPSTTLDVGGNATIGLTSTTGYSLVVQNSGANDTTGIRLTSGGTDNGYFITAYNSVSKYASLQAGDNTAYRNIVLNLLGGNVGIGISPTYKLHVSGTGYFTDNVRFANDKGLLFENASASAVGSIKMGTSVTNNLEITNGTHTLSLVSLGTLVSSNFMIGAASLGTSATNTIAVYNGTAPTTSATDIFQMYSNDITAGNAAPHFRTENGAVVKIYQQTSAVGTASWVGGAGSTVTDLDTFDGYTIGQIVKALRNAGFLQ